MKLIDTHSHLYDEAFDADRDEALARAAAEGVGLLLLPAIDSESHERLFGLCRRHPQQCIPMMGLHPTSVNDNPRWREELAQVERYLQTPPEGITGFCAVGEIGLDLYWSRDFHGEQTEVFRRQIELALQYGCRSPCIRAMPGPRPWPSCANFAAGVSGASSTPIRTGQRPTVN